MRNAAGEVGSLEQRHSKQERQLKSIENRLDRSRAAESPQEEIDDMAIRFGECKKIQAKMSRETGSVVLLRVHEGRRKDSISCLLDHSYLVSNLGTGTALD
jgi:hypothetical protein